MRTVNRVLGVMLAGLLTGYGPVATSLAGQNQVTNTPIIRFAQKMDGPQQPGGKQCSTSIKAAGQPGYKVTLSDAGCGNDVATFYKLENVRSSTLFALHSEKSCERGDWEFTLRATKNPTTSIWLDTRDLKNLKKGDIVAPGIMVHDIYYDHGNIEGKLSCIWLIPPEL